MGVYDTTKPGTGISRGNLPRMRVISSKSWNSVLQGDVKPRRHDIDELMLGYFEVPDTNDPSAPQLQVPRDDLPARYLSIMKYGLRSDQLFDFKHSFRLAHESRA